MKSIASRFAFVPAMCLIPVASFAQHSVSVPVEVVHTSNPTLEAVSEGSISVVRISPEYSIVSIDGAVRTEVSLGAVLERSSNTVLSANRSDPRLTASWQWSTPTAQFGLRGSLLDTSTRASEFDSTGRVVVDSTQRATELGADWAQDLSPVTNLALRIGHTNVDYQTPLLVGYRESVASATVEQSLDEVSRISVATDYGLLYPEDLQRFPKGKRSSLFFDYETALSELWLLGVGVGRVRTNADVKRNSTVGRLQLGYQGERVSSTFDWRREVAPSGSVAGYGRTDGYLWTSRYALTPETNLDLLISRYKSLEEGGGVGRTAFLVLRSALTEFWTISVSYGVRQSAPAGETQARSNSVGLGLSYSHPDL